MDAKAALRSTVGIAATCALAGTTVPPASATPPDFSGYHPVDPKPFMTLQAYGGGGLEFSTPSGQLCRIVIISRGEFAYGECFGELHGSAQGNQYIKVETNDSSDVRPATQDAFVGHDEKGPGNIIYKATPTSGYGFLPPGSSLTYTASVWSGTCAVTATTTSCTVKPTVINDGTKSFVLTPTETTIE